MSPPTLRASGRQRRELLEHGRVCAALLAGVGVPAHFIAESVNAQRPSSFPLHP
jgi:hypothetical protein